MKMTSRNILSFQCRYISRSRSATHRLNLNCCQKKHIEKPSYIKSKRDITSLVEKLPQSRSYKKDRYKTSKLMNIDLYSKQSPHFSSVTDILPEFFKHYSIWGGSGIILKTLHAQNIPYWGCMSLTNVMVRSSLVPLVIKGAKTSAKFANVAPEVQFLTSSYINDAKKLKDSNAPPSHRLNLLMATGKTLRGIWKLHGVNPLDVFKSPLMQIPVFWYFSVDIRKLINGGDPALAQELTESGFFWITDLTEPDPWFGLPILSGLLLYLNVEVAVGKQTLSGETASKSNLARYLKDGFQSLAVFMPCLMSQSPAGVQIYLMTSFIFTLFQGASLRNDTFRGLVGLPLKGAPRPEGKFVKEFIHLNKLERQTYGVLAPSAYSSFRPYAQMFSKQDLEEMENESKNERKMSSNLYEGVVAPQFQPLYEPSSTYLIVEQLKSLDSGKNQKKQKESSISLENLPSIAPSADEVMVRFYYLNPLEVTHKFELLFILCYFYLLSS